MGWLAMLLPASVNVVDPQSGQSRQRHRRCQRDRGNYRCCDHRISLPRPAAPQINCKLRHTHNSPAVNARLARTIACWPARRRIRLLSVVSAQVVVSVRYSSPGAATAEDPATAEDNENPANLPEQAKKVASACELCTQIAQSSLVPVDVAYNPATAA